MKIIIRLGDRVRIDGEIFTCKKLTEHLDSDFGVGPVVRRITATRANDSGFMIKIQKETEE